MKNRPRPTKEIGERIVAARGLLGLTQRSFAALLGRGVSAILTMEKGRVKKIPAEILYRISRLGIRPIWVLSGKGNVIFDPAVSEWPSPDCTLPTHLQVLVSLRGDLHGAPTPRHRGYHLISPTNQALGAGLLACRVCGGRVPSPPPGKRLSGTDLCDNPECRATDRTRRWRESYQHKADQLGFAPCRACWAVEPLPGKTQCQACIDKEKRRAEDRNNARLSRGICRHCDNKVAADDFLCPEHRKETSLSWARNSPAFIQAAKDRLDAMTPDERVAHLRASYRARYTKRYLRAKRLGTCYRCGEPRAPGINWPVCRYHLRESNLLRALRLLKVQKT